MTKHKLQPTEKLLVKKKRSDVDMGEKVSLITNISITFFQSVLSVNHQPTNAVFVRLDCLGLSISCGSWEM